MKRQAPTRLRHRARKALFVLPNLFTLACLGAGLYAATCLFDPSSGLRPAAWAVLAAMIFDLFDGRVARITRTQSEFGTQLDSLADMVSFGLVPALMIHRWTESLGSAALTVAFTYAAGAALRLARFNVLSRGGAGARSHFLGLPTPIAAGAVVAATLQLPAEPWTPTVVAYGAVTLSLLMLSNVRYRTFKDKDRVNVIIVSGVALAALAAAIPTTPATAVAVTVTAYVVLGPLEALLHRVRLHPSPNPAEEPN